MNSVRQWWKVQRGGEKTRMLGVRLSDAEEERLEELRRMLRLRSGSEVVRFALQVVECVCNGKRIDADSADEVVANVAQCLGSEQCPPTSGAAPTDEAHQMSTAAR